MVRAILEGRKTQTRRVVKDKDIPHRSGFHAFPELDCPYGQPGDRLWVKEGYARWFDDYIYRATPPSSTLIDFTKHKWNNARFMPRSASRITLEITDVRVQRVQEISENDALAEGVNCDSGLECPDCGWLGWEDSRGVKEVDPDEDSCFSCPKCGELTAHHPLDEQNRMEFHKLWDAINGKKHPWASNPWVWAITFKRIDPTADSEALAE